MGIVVSRVSLGVHVEAAPVSAATDFLPRESTAVDPSSPTLSHCSFNLQSHLEGLLRRTRRGKGGALGGGALKH
jgi:hypothetical protein